jgi:SAM-dependent methyltransferase
MTDFRQRSRMPEYMDDATVVGDDVLAALTEIEYVNRFLGGTRATLHALKHYLPDARHGALTLLDIGTGAADIPIAIVQWARLHDLDIHLVAVDLNPAICALARHNTMAYPEITIREADVFALPFDPEAFDIVHSAMFLHHFPQAAAADILRIMYACCRQAVIINDLHRHPLAFYSITWLARWFSRSPMFQHDAPVSVLRGYKRPEWEELGQLSGIGHLRIKRRWPYRFVVTAAK